MRATCSEMSQGMAREAVLPMQTPQHALHSAMWIVPGFAFPELCLACALTRLGEPEGLALLRKKVLREFAALLGSATHPGHAIFKEDLRVQHHLATTALGRENAMASCVPHRHSACRTCMSIHSRCTPCCRPP